MRVIRWYIKLHKFLPSECALKMKPELVNKLNITYVIMSLHNRFTRLMCWIDLITQG